jgi:putative N-acetylmannosamine-6-phosphate epimerase
MRQRQWPFAAGCVDSTRKARPVENHLLELLEYRNVLGALTTSIDGLLVAAVAVDTADAEIIAASTAGYENEDYRVTTSEYGSLHVARGNEMRLIVLAEPNTDASGLRELMVRQLEAIEESIRV